jgi:hypothetical protein
MSNRPAENPSVAAISRREAVRRIALLMGGTLVGSQALLRGQSLPDNRITASFSEADRMLLDEIGETILPATEIPGAKAVQIGAFMVMMVTDCYNAKEQAVFRDGLGRVDRACREKFGKTFLESSPAQRTGLANALDAEQRVHGTKKGADDPPHFFQMMKELTILGYFSSEIGCTQALRYIEVPGAFHGDVPYKKGDRAWFE